MQRLRADASCDANAVKPRHSNPYASASEKTRPRVRRESARARIEEGSCCLLSQDPVPFFFSLSLSPPLFLSLLLTSDLRQRRTRVSLCCFVPCIHRERTRSLLRARVCACAHVKLRVPQREKERGRERTEPRRTTRGPSRWRRINRCALHLAPPHPPRNPPLYAFWAATLLLLTPTFARGRVAVYLVSRARFMRIAQAIHI